MSGRTIEQWIPQTILDKYIGRNEDRLILIWSIIMIFMAFIEQEGHFMAPIDNSNLLAILEGWKLRVCNAVPNELPYNFYPFCIRTLSYHKVPQNLSSEAYRERVKASTKHKATFILAPNNYITALLYPYWNTLVQISPAPPWPTVEQTAMMDVPSLPPQYQYPPTKSPPPSSL